MPPNTASTPVPPEIDNEVEIIKRSLSGKGSEGQPASSYPGIWKYPTNRDASFRNAEDWMKCKFTCLILYKN